MSSMRLPVRSILVYPAHAASVAKPNMRLKNGLAWLIHVETPFALSCKPTTALEVIVAPDLLLQQLLLLMMMMIVIVSLFVL